VYGEEPLYGFFIRNDKGAPSLPKVIENTETFPSDWELVLKQNSGSFQNLEVTLLLIEKDETFSLHSKVKFISPPEL